MVHKVSVLLLTFFIAFGHSIQINYIQVPLAVRNDSHKPIILDCIYSVRPDDTDLVVKWLLNDEMVYQWIPPQKPQSHGVLKNRLDLNHKSSNDPKMKHRAMKILNPTTEIAGLYKCFVSTFSDEDFSWKSMTVYEPEDNFTVRELYSNETVVTFICMATGIYPLARLFLYKDEQGSSYLQNLLTPYYINNTIDKETGRYSLHYLTNVSRTIIHPGTLLHCELRIPSISYKKVKTLLYYPIEPVENNSPSATIKQATKVFFFAVVLVSRL